MQVNHVKDKRKSLLMAVLIYCAIVLLLFFIRFWPPYGKSEQLIAEGGGGGGMTINFGNTDLGKGENFEEEALEVKMEQTPVSRPESTQEEILAQDNVGEAIKLPPKREKKEKEPIEKPKIQPTQSEPEKPVKKTNSALSNMIKGSKSGDGNSSQNGNQGSSNGSLSSGNYYGNGGSGGGTGGGNGTGNGTGNGSGSGSGSGGGNGSGSGSGASYNLTGRRKANLVAVDNSCNSFGRVVIEITVDKLGNTINAVNGKGTKADNCLIQLAKQYALRTKWNPSESAAEKQVGTITYNFKNTD